MTRCAAGVRARALPFLLLPLSLLWAPARASAQTAPIATQYREVADRLIDAALADSAAHERLTELVDRFGHRFSGSESLERAIDWILDERKVGSLLDRVQAGSITRGGGGADIGPIMALGVPGMGLNVDGSRYFWYHHTAADTIDKLDPHEVALCVAAIAVMAYVIADLPQPLPRAAAN